jgi:RNase H-like domain found in reverse transcriptase/Integrase zinc binding domain
MVIDILKKENFYLSRRKLRFLEKELKVLGHIIDNDGIRMDPTKVDGVLAWKVPTNRDLLRGFLGSVGYLADDLACVRVPMGVLSALTGDTVPFCWEFTHQRAFDEVKSIVAESRSRYCVPLNYEPGHEQIFMVTDGCATGIAGLVSQGKDWKTAKVAAFYSAKLNSAQQNYPVHEIELLAGIETMLRQRDILQGVHFKWITDHKGLIHFMNQKNLSGWQARWIEKIGEFDFEIIYIPGSENVLADALSRMYSNESPGTVRGPSEYTEYDDNNEHLGIHEISMPLLAGVEAVAVRITPQHARKTEPGAETGRPETKKEWLSRIKDHFVLKGPREQKEGGKETDNVDSTQRASVLTAQTAPEGPEQQNQTNLIGISGQVENLEDINSPTPDTSLIGTVSGGREGIDILEVIKGKYGGDLFFKAIIEKPREFQNFEVTKGGLVYLKDQGRKLVCIPKIVVDGRNIREIIIAEAHSLLAHLGMNKTLSYLRDQVWWKDMVHDTRIYCESCRTCKRSKPSNQKPYGLLNPLPILAQPWQSIGIDFVGPLPESKNRDGAFDSITIVIDLLTAMVHLIPSRTNYKAKEIAELMFEHVYKLHGLPKSIVSDRDVLFTSTFWQRLHDLVGTQLKMSSAYHPETDGSTERANRTVTQMLRRESYNCIIER